MMVEWGIDADQFMRTRARGSPSWLEPLLRDRIRWRRLVSSDRKKPPANGAGHTFHHLVRRDHATCCWHATHRGRSRASWDRRSTGPASREPFRNVEHQSGDRYIEQADRRSSHCVPFTFSACAILPPWTGTCSGGNMRPLRPRRVRNLGEKSTVPAGGMTTCC
jgi:hypothetical protein